MTKKMVLFGEQDMNASKIPFQKIDVFNTVAYLAHATGENECDIVPMHKIVFRWIMHTHEKESKKAQYTHSQGTI